MNILLLVNKAISELDFAIPLLWKIKKEIPETNISVVYLTINKKKITREGYFYSRLLTSFGIDEYDFSDFISRKDTYFIKVIKKLHNTSWADLQHLSEYKVNKFSLTRIPRGVARLLENLVCMRIDYSSIFNRFKPDITLFAHRGYPFPGKKNLIDYLYRYKNKVILYPHGSFISNGRDYLHFSEKENNEQKPLPEFCDYWYSLAKDETAKHYPLNAKQMHCVGYPGLDSEWLRYIKQNFVNDYHQNDEIRCLFIIRKFVSGPPGYGELKYDEFLTILGNVTRAFKRSGKNIKIIIKPHPANDYVGFEKIMKRIGYINWTLTHEPIYHAITQCDCVIAVPSTSILVPVMYGLPVMVINCSVMQQFEKEWWFMTKLFSGFKYFVNTSEVENKTVKYLEYVKKSQINIDSKNDSDEIRFFRKFFQKVLSR